MIHEQNLHTVCEEANCPNVGECWERGTATFMILGDVCTRRCGFCNVQTGKPTWNDPLEPMRVAASVKRMGLRHAVITSVDRDDLPDYGAGAFVGVIRSIRMLAPGCAVEVLTPDFRGQEMPLAKVIHERPDVFNHNVETVPRLYPKARRGSDFMRSARVLRLAKEMGGDQVVTKSGLMVGLGESFEEMVEAFAILREHRVQVLTVGQYLRPTEQHLPVVRYWHPDEFDALERAAYELGFESVAAGPLVRSSYHADEQRPRRSRTVGRRQPPADGDRVPRTRPRAAAPSCRDRQLGLPSLDPAQGQHPHGAVPDRHGRADRVNIVVFVWQLHFAHRSTTPAPSSAQLGCPGERPEHGRVRGDPLPAHPSRQGLRRRGRSRAAHRQPTWSARGRRSTGRPSGSRPAGAPFEPLDSPPWWVTVFTSMFMHGGILHIAFNMLFLWIFGNNIEDSMGRPRFLLFYLLGRDRRRLRAGAARPRIATVPTIGASGAIAGVLGGYLLLYPRARVLTLIFIIFFVTLIEIPAVVMLGIWFVLQFLPAVGQVATPDVSRPAAASPTSPTSAASSSAWRRSSCSRTATATTRQRRTDDAVVSRCASRAA